MNKIGSKFFSLSQKIKYKLFKEDVFLDYKEALNSCSKNGYENNDIIALVKRKAISYRELIKKEKYLKVKIGVIPLLELVNRISANQEKIVIYDFGGADGIYYLQLRKCLPLKTKILWYVIETPEMVNEMKDLESDELKFFDSIENAKQETGEIPNIFHTSGTLQYTSNPIENLEKICNAGAEFLVFNRSSLINSEDNLISIQTSLLSWHGEGMLPEGFNEKVIKYPHSNISKKKFEDTLFGNYNILYTYEDSSGIKKLNQEDIVGLCYVCQKKMNS